MGDSRISKCDRGNGGESDHQKMWLEIGFMVVVSGLVAVDMSLTNRGSGNPIKRAAIWSLLWFSLALLFSGVLAAVLGSSAAGTFLVAYLVEKSLSVDNLVVMMMIFRAFKIPARAQPRVLTWGIIGAMIFRTVFIFAGIALLERFESVLRLFGVLLLYAAYKMAAETDEQADEPGDLSESKLLWMFKKLVNYDPSYQGNEFWTRKDGKLFATPVLAALVVIEASDVVFAIDSIPCTLGITSDPFLALSSNMLAILGLRALYVLLAGGLDKIGSLRVGLAAMMAFVGVKMVLADIVLITPVQSLFIIIAILGVTIVSGVMLGKFGAQRSETALVVHSNVRVNQRGSSVLRMLSYRKTSNSRVTEERC